jgi:hypothetical protein
LDHSIRRHYLNPIVRLAPMSRDDGWHATNWIPALELEALAQQIEDGRVTLLPWLRAKDAAEDSYRAFVIRYLDGNIGDRSLLAEGQTLLEAAGRRYFGAPQARPTEP